MPNINYGIAYSRGPPGELYVVQVALVPIQPLPGQLTAHTASIGQLEIQLYSSIFFIKYCGHAATLLVYFIYRGARAENQTRDCLTAVQHANCGLRRHPKGLRCHPMWATLPLYVGYVATLNVGYVATLKLKNTRKLIFMKIFKLLHMTL